MMEPKISVIVPVYNAQETIKRCLDSLLKQTFPCYIIVINDGSTDQTRTVLKNYSNVSQIKIITQSNSGASAARNLGLCNVKTTYVTFVDADDYVNNDYLYNLYKNMNHPSIDMAVCSWKTVGRSEKKYIQNDEMLPASDVIKSIFSPNGPKGYLWNKLFKTEIILNNKIRFNTEIQVAEDMLFCCEYLVYSRRVRSSSNVVYNYVLSSNSISDNIQFDKGNVNFYLDYLNALNTIILIMPVSFHEVLIEVKANICNLCCDLIRMINFNNIIYDTKKIKKRQNRIVLV